MIKKIETLFIEYKQEGLTLPEEQTSAFVRYFEMFSSITTDYFYVLDIRKKQFCYVKPNAFFLCDFSAKDVLSQGYDFYSKIVHSEDLSLWTDMRNAVLQYFINFKEKRDEIDFFSCKFRLQRNYSFLPSCHLLPQIVFHQMKPVCVDDKLCYLICSIRSTVTNEQGNLCLYYKDGLTYEKYNAITRRWKQFSIEPLTELERAILMLVQQGESVKKIADYLYKSYHTIRNKINALFIKLGVHSVHEAIEFANNHDMIYQPKSNNSKLVQLPYKDSFKKTRNLITQEKQQRIQQNLDDGKSIRQTAKLEGVAESAIRYWIGKGRFLVFNS